MDGKWREFRSGKQKFDVLRNLSGGKRSQFVFLCERFVKNITTNTARDFLCMNGKTDGQRAGKAGIGQDSQTDARTLLKWKLSKGLTNAHEARIMHIVKGNNKDRPINPTRQEDERYADIQTD